MKKNNQIQFLRGLLCIIVIIYHFTYQYYNLFFLENIFDNVFFRKLGSFGVTGFLVLSGFYIFRKNNDDDFILNRFLYWVKRVLKIYIVYLIAITIIFIVKKITTNSGIISVTFYEYIKNVFKGATYE